MAEIALGIEEMPGGSSEPAPVPLTRRTAHGFAWMIGQTLVTKVTGIVGQIVIARFLAPTDFGIACVAIGASGFPGVLRDAGLQSILIQRQRHLKRWVNPVFWLSLALGCLAGLILFVISPVMAARYHEPRLVNLIVLLGIGSIVYSLGTVPNSLVQIQLRFRFQAVLSFVCALATTVLNIVMAWRGWGPYSFVVPTLLVNMMRLLTLWSAARFPIRLRLDVRRWRFLWQDSGTLMVTQMLLMAVVCGDYLILGATYRDDKDVVGQFYFAFNLSMQALTLLTVNLGGVLFPALVRLGSDPARQTQAFLRSTRLMAIIAIPACLLQAAVAGPGMHLVFNPKWYPAIPIVQVLSGAMAIHAVGTMYLNLTTAQGRFRLQLITCAIGSAIFLASVAVASQLGRGLTVAVAETIYFAVTDPLWLYIVLKRDLKNAFFEMARVYVAPLLAGLSAIAVALLLTVHLPETRIGNVFKIGAITVIVVSIYVPLIRIMAPKPWQELLALRNRAGSS